MVVAEGRLWLRLSAAVYNCEAEYDILRDAVLELGREAAAAAVGRPTGQPSKL